VISVQKDLSRVTSELSQAVQLNDTASRVTMTMELSFLQVINIFAFILIIVFNILSNAGIIGGQTNADVSAKYESYFTPAGYAFSIWLLIFVALGAFALYQALPRNVQNEKNEKIHLLFLFSALAMIGWIFSFNNEVIWLSMIMIFFTWLPIAFVYFRLNGLSLLTLPDYCSLDYWFYNWPFTLYFSWLTVANVANFFTLSVKQDWDNINTPEGSALAITIVGVVALVILLLYSDVFFVAVVVWAVIAVGVKQSSYEIISFTATACAIILLVAAALLGLVACVIKFVRNQQPENYQIVK
jgi:benzodiazapine receptor